MKKFPRIFWNVEELNYHILMHWSFGLWIHSTLKSYCYVCLINKTFSESCLSPELQPVCKHWRWVYPWCRECPSAEGASSSATNLHFITVFPTLHQRRTGKLEGLQDDSEEISPAQENSSCPCYRNLHSHRLYIFRTWSTVCSWKLVWR